MSNSRGTSSFDALQEVWSRRKWPAIASLAATFTAATAVSLTLPDIYRSTATVLVKREHVSEAMVKPSITGELETRLRTIGQEILSRSRLMDLIDRFRLYPELRAKVAPEVLVERMRREIHLETRDVEPGAARGETIAFAISFQGMDPGKVADVTNALASFYVDENLKARESQTAGTAEFLKTQLESMKKRLDEQAARLEEFNRSHMGELPQQVGANLATLERLNAQLQQNRDQQNRVLERLEAPDRRSSGDEGGGGPSGSESPDTRLLHLERQLAALRARYSDSYPDVVQIRAEIAALRRGDAAPGASDKPQRTARARPPAPGLGSELETLKGEERKLMDQIASYQTRVESAPGREQELAAVTRDYEATKELYQSLLQRDEEAHLADDLQKRRMGEEVRILDPAVPSPLPAAPDRLRLVLVGLALSIAATFGVVVLAEHADTSFHSVDAVRAFTKIPVLASIPRIDVATGAERVRRAGLVTVAAVLGVACLAVGAYLVAHDNEQLASLLSRGAP